MRNQFAPLVLIAGFAIACSKEKEVQPPPPVVPVAPAASAATEASTDTRPIAAMTVRTNGAASTETPAAVATDPRAARLAAISKESEDAMTAYYAAFDAARGDNKDLSMEDLKKIQEQVKEPDSKVWIASAQKLLDEDPTDIAALNTIVWMLDNSREPADRKSLVALIEKHHMDRPEMGDLCDRFSSENPELLTKLVANSKHVDVRGRACNAMAEGLKNDIRMAEYLATAKPEDLDGMKGYLGEEKLAALKTFDAIAAQQEIEKIYERVAKEFSDVKVNAGTKRETTLGKQANGALFEIRNLAVGKPAPEIAGADLDSVDFKLSDYKGKVVLLDFWGNW